ncbi:hypothetical protein AOQ84DRAFT_277216, partial [Glonium stellatum]
ALRALTNLAASNHAANPKETLHRPADHESSNSFLRKHFPSAHLAQHLDSLESAHHMGNYVIDRETGVKKFEPMSIYVRLGMHLLYYGTEQSKMLHLKEARKLLEEESIKIGREYDTPQSKAHIEPFITSFELWDSLSQLKEPDPAKYDTFNHFFAREIREDARPVQHAHDSEVVCSPADCRLTAFPSVDLATKYWIKGQGFTLDKLLGSDDVARRFDGGSMIIARLAPQDYHRWHSPINGTVVAINEIPGSYYTVNPQAINEATTLDVFCENRRSAMVLKREETGSPVAMVAVGAMLVGSIKYNPGAEAGAQVRRGQCLGAFRYGGSTVIVIYPRGEVALDEDLVKNSMEHSCETLMRVGWSTGRS